MKFKEYLKICLFMCIVLIPVFPVGYAISLIPNKALQVIPTVLSGLICGWFMIKGLEWACEKGIFDE